MTAKKPAAKKLVQQSPSPSKSEQLASTDDLPPSPSTIAKIIAEWRVVLLSLLFVVSFVGQHFGWWTAEQGQQIRDHIPVADKPNNVSASAGDTDIQDALDAFDTRLTRIEAAVEKLSPPDPKPPQTLRVVYLDKAGVVIAEDTPDQLELVSGDSKRVRITSNQGPQPPPDPKPDPQPDPTPVVMKVNLRLVYEPNTVKPELTSILNHSTYWVKFRADGNSESFYTSGTQNSDALKAIEYAKSQNVPMPFIVIEDKMTSKPVKAFQVPQTIEEIAKLIGGK